MTGQAIYLDGFATVPIAPEVRDVILASWEQPANAGSPHFAGEMAATTIARARSAVATLIGANPEEVTFTSGATESNNVILFGICKWALNQKSQRRRIIVSAIEHKAILEPVASLRAMGFEIVVAPVARDGLVDLAALRDLVDEHTLIVSVMALNNETGVIQPIAEVVELAHAAGAYVHSDMAQAAGKIAVDVHELDIDYASLSAHKMHGPMGVGALYNSRTAPKPEPLFFGGGQQGGLRPGTEPVALLAGFGKAAELAMQDLDRNSGHSERLFKRLLSQLELRQVRYEITTGAAPRVPGGGSIILQGVNAEDLVIAVSKTLSLSTGSACTSGQVLPSHVLQAIGIDDRQAASILRIYVNRYNTEAEIDLAAVIMSTIARKLGAATGPIRQ